MSLPSGYKRVEYVQSVPSQYSCIDTGFKPNQNTRVRIVAEWSPSSTTSWLFGARNGTNKGAFAFLTYKGAYRADYGTATTTLPSSPSGKITVDLDKNAIKLNGVTVATASEQTFTTTCNLVLFANNTAGTIAGYTSGKLYSCQIYDNGMLVRDFIPCKNASGTIGLWDDVNSKFYTNAGTGVFTAGPEVSGTHKALVNGTAYEMKSGKCLVNGTGYALKKGRTLIDGTGYDIALQSGTPLSEIPVGNTVKIAVNGTMRDWIVVNQGIPSDSALYDDSCNGTWLLMKDIYENRQWNNENVNEFKDSSVLTYLNNDFIELVDSSIRGAMQQVMLPAYIGNKVLSLSCKMFLLSAYELGWTNRDSSYIPHDGDCLGYFDQTYTKDSKRIAYLNNVACGWWTRSANTGTKYAAFAVDDDGGYYSIQSTGTMGIRPAMILPFDTPVADDGTVLG